MTNLEKLRAAIIEAVPEINTSMCGQCVFDGKGEHECDYTRPITLADVLRAIKDKYMKGTLQKEGEFKNGTEWFGEIAWDWNLAKDNLDDQSPETIDFLTSVLCK